MAEFNRSRSEVDQALGSRRSGAVLLTLGWIFLGMAALLGVFAFNAIRAGDKMWPIFTGIVALVGLICLTSGSIFRSRK
jgi:hypothetical protein